MALYVIARTAKKRPTLIHALPEANRTSYSKTIGSSTLCGVEMVGWSRTYLREPIPQMLCLRCKAHEEV